jgi:hypothetical protein
MGYPRISHIAASCFACCVFQYRCILYIISVLQADNLPCFYQTLSCDPAANLADKGNLSLVIYHHHMTAFETMTLQLKNTLLPGASVLQQQFLRSA